MVNASIQQKEIKMRTSNSDFYIVLIPILIMISLAWLYLFSFANEMDMDMNTDSMSMDMNTDSMDMKMDSMDKFSLFAMPMDSNWTKNDFIVMNLMWIIMMFAMMFPSALMFLFLFYSMRKNMATVVSPKSEIILLSSMYFLIWTIFSISACYLQYVFHNYSVVNMMGAFTSNYVAAATLIGAGLFQFSNLKNACLEKCRNPLAFIMGIKITSNKDVLKIGLLHGLYCLGCCWALMLILFVNGVMNMLWVVIITVAVLAEKLIPFEKLTSRFFGFLLVLWGTYLIFF